MKLVDSRFGEPSKCNNDRSAGFDDDGIVQDLEHDVCGPTLFLDYEENGQRHAG